MKNLDENNDNNDSKNQSNLEKDVYQTNNETQSELELDVIVPIILSLILLYITYSVYIYLYNAENKNLKENFERDAILRSTVFDDLFKQHIFSIELASTYIEQSSPNRKQFDAFANTSATQIPGKAAFGFNEYVLHENRDKFEIEAAKIWKYDLNNLNLTKLEIKERNETGDLIIANNRSFYFAVKYIYPYEGNEAAVLYDIGSDETRLKGINYAKENNTNVLTGPIKLVQANQIGALCFSPVYNISTHDSRGLATGVFKLGEIFELVYDDNEINIGVYLFDITENIQFIHGIDFHYLHSPESISGLNIDNDEEYYNSIHGDYEYEVELLLGTRTYLIRTVSLSHYSQGVDDSAVIASLIVGTISINLVLFSILNIYVIRKRESAQLKRNQSLIEAKQFLLTFVCHEIRNPLHCINAILDLMRSDHSITPNIRDDIDGIESSTITMLNLVNDVLDMEKITSKGDDDLILSKDKVDLNIMLNRIVTQHKRLAKLISGASITYNTDIPYILGDQRRIQQIISNGLTNAIKVTDEGNIHINATLLVEDDINKINRLSSHKKIDKEQAGDYILFEVKDAGPGLSNVDADNLFEEYNIGNSIKKRKNTKKLATTGLGLNICKRIINKVGGNIGLYDTKIDGAVFWFIWPIINERTTKLLFPVLSFHSLWNDDNDNNEMKNTEEIKKEIIVKERNKMNEEELNNIMINKLNDYQFIIIDDEKLNVQVLQRILKKRLKVNNIIKFYDGLDLLDNSEKLLFNNNVNSNKVIILMDIIMERSRGNEIVKELRNLGWEGIVIATTGNARQCDIASYISDGFNDVLTKPFLLKDLKIMLRKFI